MLIQKIKVKIVGIKPLLFNKFNGIQDEAIPTEKKFDVEDSKVVIKSSRISSFLFDMGDTASGRNTIGAIKMFTGRKHKSLIVQGNAFIGIEPITIPLTRNSKPITFKKFGENGITEYEDKTGKGKPQIVKRPMIDTPWEAEFQINLVDNDFISFDDLKGWFEKGGIMVGLGAWRPRYGQFTVEKFEKMK